MSERESVNDKPPSEERSYKLNRQQVVILWLTFGFSVVSLIISIILQFHFISADQFAKAKAGNAKAQSFLADHYHEIGDTKESIYWFKNASMNSGWIGAYAKNNLAVLYIQTGIANNTDQYMRTRVLDLFEHAAKAGLEKAAKNMYAYLLLSPKDSFDFDNEEYEAKLNQAKDYLNKYDAFDSELSELSVEWNYVGTESGSYVPADTETKAYVVKSADYIYDTESSFRWYYIYSVYEKTGDSSNFTYIYARPDQK